MGLRFRKSVKIAPGVRVNVGKKSTSVSVGGKGFRHTVSSSGRKTTTVGVPGTGLSYVSSSKKHRKPTDEAPVQYSARSHKGAGVVCLLLAALTLLIGLLSFSVGGWIFLIFCAVFSLLGFYYIRH